MKKAIGVTTIIFAGFALLGGYAMATPVEFAGDYWSQVDVTKDKTGGMWDASGLVAEGVLGGTGFTLDDSESITLDLFDLYAWGFGGNTFTVDASLSFASPALKVDGEGEGWFSIRADVTDGLLNWTSQPGDITLTDGNVLNISFETGLSIGNAADPTTIHATITNLGMVAGVTGSPDLGIGTTGRNDYAPVPEPATMLLFGTGLAGLATLRRKRMQ